MHAKTAVADGRWSRIGSTNLNVSSWVGNWELDVGIEDEGIARQMEEIYLEDLDDATEIILTDRHQVRPEHPIAPGGRAPAAGGSCSRMLTDAARMVGDLSAAVKGHRILGRPEASSLLVVGAVLFTLALLAVVLPRLTAYALAVVLGTAALAVPRKTVRLYFARSPEPDDTPHSDARPPG